MTSIQIFMIHLIMFHFFSYNAIKSYKTEGRAERLEAAEYLISAAEAGKVVHEMEIATSNLIFIFVILFAFSPVNPRV